MKTITIKDTYFLIKIPYDINLVNLIKISFSGRKWNPDVKVWQAPINEKNIAATYQATTYQGFIISPETAKEIEEWKKKLNIQNEKANEMMEMSKAVDSNIEIPKLKGELFPFQKAGVQFIEKTKGRTLIADEMGLGKTLQSIAWSILHPGKRPILVICPATLKINWQREFEKWTEVKAYIISSKENIYQLPTTYEAYIINYDIVEKQKELLKKMKFQIVILDEAHFVKNMKSQRSKAVNELTKSIPHILALTGTPILNRPVEIYNILKILSPLNFGDYWNFCKRYTNMTRTRWGMDVSGASNIDELANKLRSTVMIRREKKDVLKELPDKTRGVIPQEIPLIEYKRVEEDLINYLVEEKNKSKLQAEKINQVEQLAKIEYLKQACVRAKLPLFIEWVKDFMEGNDKLVIFAHHRIFIEKLMFELKEFNPCQVIGGISSEEKQKSIDTFMNDKNCRIFIGSITSAGMGITLTVASHLAFLELMFVPALHDQAEDRILRIGQKNACSIYYFIADKTIEQDIYNLLQEKRKIFTALMQDKNTISENQNTSILDDLITKLVNRKNEVN